MNIVKTCFILMPFTTAKCTNKELNKEDLDYIFNEIIHKAVSLCGEELKINFHISRYNQKTGSIIHGILQNIHEADIVIADLTGLNPNVMYELGVRHSIRRGTIIVTQEINLLPSDLRDYMAVPYSYSENSKEQVKNFNDFKLHLLDALNEVFTTNKYDSPIQSYFQGKFQYRKEDEIIELKENIIILNFIISEFNIITQLLVHVKENNFNEGSLPLFVNALKNHLELMHSGMNDINIKLTSPTIYSNSVKAINLINESLKTLTIAEYFEKFDDPQAKVFFNDLTVNVEKIFNSKSIMNPFYDTNKKESMFLLTLSEIFSESGEIITHYINKISEHLKSIMIDLQVEEEEILKLYQN